MRVDRIRSLLRAVRAGAGRTTRSSISRAALSWLLTSQVASRAGAAPGDLDTKFAGFGNGGRLVLRHQSEGPSGVALQLDGRIVVVGGIGNGIWVERVAV